MSNDTRNMSWSQIWLPPGSRLSNKDGNYHTSTSL
jgi:hypothetical protein